MTESVKTLCLCDSVSVSFQLQELSQLTSSQDCSTGEQTPGDPWSCPSLERSEMVIPELGKVLKSLSAALGMPTPSPGSSLGTAGAGLCLLLAWGHCKVPLLPLSPALRLQCGNPRVCRALCGNSDKVLGTVDVQKGKTTDLESCPCS